MTKKKTPKYLNRYTSIPFMLDILYKKELTLLSPEKWEDRNDSYSISEYKKKKGLKTVLALCFISRRETFHHWNIFAGEYGVCIEFYRNELEKHIEDVKKKSKDGDYTSRDVTYKTIKKFEKDRLTIDELPFIKRYPYRDESEFRIIYTNMNSVCPSNIPIKISSIKRITLSPWIPKIINETFQNVIKLIPECKNLKINYSRLLETDEWKKKINEIKV